MPKISHEELPQIFEEKKILEDEKEENESQTEDFKQYLKSGFSKDEVFSISTLDFTDNTDGLEMKKLKTNFSEREKFMMSNSFKNKLDVDTFLGKKFKERGRLKVREGFCYENFSEFKEKSKRCPCYSNCEIF